MANKLNCGVLLDGIVCLIPGLTSMTTSRTHRNQELIFFYYVSNVQFLLYHYSQIQRVSPSGKLHSQPPNPSRSECRSTLADQIKHLTEIAERRESGGERETGRAGLVTHSLFLKLLNNS